tara:strand:+ start:21144 stop:22058 length:915 start_codon:yes stop_codon:yes gene_type:complete
MNKNFKKIVKDISSLKIQGAENVAKMGSKAIYVIVKDYKHKNSKELWNDLNKAKKLLFNARATEPGLRNAVNYILHNLHHEDVNTMKHDLHERLKTVQEHFKKSKDKIIKVGARMIKNGMIVFTHCHSSTVTRILIEAKKQGKKFEVYNTETRPLFQGRITAKELASHGIKVTHFVDSGGRLALKESDLMLIGCDAITSTGKVINKIGSEMFAEIAIKYHTPVYVCTNSWKFDPQTIFGYETEIEKRYYKEVWPNKPKNVKILNYAFEKINPELITGIISELGIYNCDTFIHEVQDTYPFMFEK